MCANAIQYNVKLHLQLSVGILEFCVLCLNTIQAFMSADGVLNQLYHCDVKGIPCNIEGHLIS